MFRLKLLFCSDSAALDARTQTVSAFHIAEVFRSASFPAVMNRLTVIAYVTRDETDPAQVELQLRVMHGDQQLFVGPIPLNYAAGGLLARAVVVLQGLVIPAPGELSARLVNGEQLQGSWTVTATQVGQIPTQLTLQPAPVSQ